VELEEFSLGNSWVHDLGPRVKIVVTLVFSLVVALNQHLPGTAMSFVLPVALLACAQVSFK
jgi:cobalt/nickel transport system permease protein